MQGSFVWLPKHGVLPPVDDVDVDVDDVVDVVDDGVDVADDDVVDVDESGWKGWWSRS
jgi:hypothetical protein